MGIDGVNRLHIRGPKEVLDVLQNCGLAVPFPDHMPWVYLVQNYFGPENVKMDRAEDKYLYATYAFRNKPCYEYLLHILKKYPQLWMKNEYYTEEGFCGMWIAHMWKGQPSIQSWEWTEPCLEELAFCEDYSRGLDGDTVIPVAPEQETLETAAPPVKKTPIKKRVIPVSK